MIQIETIQTIVPKHDHSVCAASLTMHLEITAPLYWWREFGSHHFFLSDPAIRHVMNKILEKELTLEDFSCEMIFNNVYGVYNYDYFKGLISQLNANRKKYLETKDKVCLWQIVQLLPSSYIQKQSCLLDCRDLSIFYRRWKDHDLTECRKFWQWIDDLPHIDVIRQMAATYEKL